ncbi:MAG: c-type cytochrome [Psychroserpens sp.]|uniref:c-type cytochrome n=1 Tax=Psychroserpens sp. TaxID=2020870 RepID=UPI0030014D0C
MKTLIILLFALVLISCNTSKNKDYANAEIINLETLQEHPGKKLMEINCYVCHSPSANHDNRLAPPMIAIKKHYISSDTSKEEFINTVQDWIKNPSEENAKMFGAVRRFDVMPKTPFPEETIEQIADYMFDNNIEQPEWFEDHFKNKKKSN